MKLIRRNTTILSMIHLTENAYKKNSIYSMTLNAMCKDMVMNYVFYILILLVNIDHHKYFPSLTFCHSWMNRTAGSVFCSFCFWESHYNRISRMQACVHRRCCIDYKLYSPWRVSEQRLESRVTRESNSP